MSLDKQQYESFHTDNLIPLDICIDIDLFEKQMDEWSLAFRQWGIKHTHRPRYGAPLVNLNGSMHNNPEPVCYPLDQWNAVLPEQERIYDPMIQTPTEMLNLSCFDPLNDLKPYMYRSCILKWHEGGLFYPHTDTWLPSDIIRLWGTNDPENMLLQFDKDRKSCSPPDVTSMDYELVPAQNIQAGRLYIIDTHVIHDAQALGNNVFQFFIALGNDSMQTLKEHML